MPVIPKSHTTQERSSQMNADYFRALFIRLLPGKWSGLFTLMHYLSLVIEGPAYVLTALSVLSGLTFLLAFRECLYLIKVHLGSGRVEDAPLPLREDEALVQSSFGLLAEGWDHRPGRLSRTSQRLVFEPHDDSLPGGIIELDLTTLHSVEQTHTYPFGSIPLGQMSLQVTNQAGQQHTFSVHNPQHWLAQLSR